LQILGLNVEDQFVIVKNGMKWFSTIKNTKTPKKRFLYAVKNGDHAGKFIAYIDTMQDHHCFLAVPGNEKLKVPVKDFENGIDNVIVEFVEKLPKDVYKVLEAQHLT